MTGIGMFDLVDLLGAALTGSKQTFGLSRPVNERVNPSSPCSCQVYPARFDLSTFEPSGMWWTGGEDRDICGKPRSSLRKIGNRCCWPVYSMLAVSPWFHWNLLNIQSPVYAKSII